MNVPQYDKNVFFYVLLEIIDEFPKLIRIIRV